jgi:hypothetical protein
MPIDKTACPGRWTHASTVTVAPFQLLGPDPRIACNAQQAQQVSSGFMALDLSHCRCAISDVKGRSAASPGGELAGKHGKAPFGQGLCLNLDLCIPKHIRSWLSCVASPDMCMVLSCDAAMADEA